MTVETDSIISYARARGAQTGVTVVVSDINTPKVRTASSDHYKDGTPSTLVEPQDFRAGRVGWAVDFVFQHGGKPDTPQLAAIFNLFEPVERSVRATDVPPRATPSTAKSPQCPERRPRPRRWGHQQRPPRCRIN